MVDLVLQRRNRLLDLLVEDEGLLKMDTVEVLEDGGFVVFEAANADAAISILEKNPDVRLVFTDVEMPGSMDGLVRALRPQSLAADRTAVGPSTPQVSSKARIRNQCSSALPSGFPSRSHSA
jgi:CheY-like chemotaxis protein